MADAATVPWESFDVTHPDHSWWVTQTGKCLASDCAEHSERKTIMGFVSEDGTVVGSIDVNQLDEIEPKSDEARAQLDALKAERDAGQAQANADAEKLAEQARAQDPSADVADDTRDAQGIPTGEPQSSDQPAQEQPAETSQPEQSEQPAATAGRRSRNQPQGG